MKGFCTLFLLLTIHSLFGQVYVEKQSRHRFAQMTLGVDLEANFGGKSQFINDTGTLSQADLSTSLRPRFLIGGTHFWGHADIYIAIPLFATTLETENQEILAFRGVETVFKYYPWRIKHNQLRPFLGVSFAPFYYEQRNNNFDFPSGPELNRTAFPLLTGLTFNTRQHLFELGVAWNYANSQDYFISRNQVENVDLPPLLGTISYKYMFDTTLGAEKGWESGQTKKVTERRAAAKKLNGFYLGAGMSSAFWLSESSYNESERPYIEKYNTSIMPDFTLGYYLHQPDINLAIGYRGYGSSTSAYGAVQRLNRKSFVLEGTKYLFDYQGFAPFVGPALSYENLSFVESFEGERTFDVQEAKVSYGLTFGWDIRPDRIQNFILRTNLRWYPNLFLDLEPGSRVSFNNLEFNFIQLIIYPNRMFRKKG
ncbi:MAG: hypothetical protein AAF206_14675 [Bacteroidota bacterium]